MMRCIPESLSVQYGCDTLPDPQCITV